MLSVTYFAPRVFDQVPALLEKLKVRSGFSWTEMARLVGVDPRTMHDWKSGKTEPRLSEFGRLAKACGIDTIASLSEIVEGARYRSPAVESEIREETIATLGETIAELQVRAARAEAELRKLRSNGDSPNP